MSSETVSSRNMSCEAIINSGSSKGKICGRKVKDNGLCGLHSKNKNPSPKLEECVVCCEELKKREKRFCEYKQGLCIHRIHKKCVIKTGKLQCPVCRLDITNAFSKTHQKQCKKVAERDELIQIYGDGEGNGFTITVSFEELLLEALYLDVLARLLTIRRGTQNQDQDQVVSQ